MTNTTALALTGISQFLLFAGIGLLIFGWIDKKEKMLYAGLFCLILPGLLGLTNLLHLYNGMSAETISEIKLKRIEGFFKGTFLLSLLAAGSIFSVIWKSRYKKAILIIVLSFTLILFFMLINIQQLS